MSVSSYEGAVKAWKQAHPHWDEPPVRLIPSSDGFEDDTDYMIAFDEGPDYIPLLGGPGPQFVRKADGRFWSGNFFRHREKMDAMRPTH